MDISSNKEQRLKIGLVGASWFSDLWYLPVIQLHPNADVYAIRSENGASAQRMAEKYGIPHVYESYEQMLELAGLDGVCIVTPNDVHEPIAAAAIRNGVHVICEKPLSVDAEGAQRMLALAQSSGVIHTVNFTYREHPAILRMKELIKDGIVGSIISGSFEYSGDYGVSGPPGWRGTASKGGVGGVLADLGSHLIDLVQYVLQEQLTDVCGEALFAHAAAHQDLAADTVNFFGRFANGIQGVFHTSWIEHQGGNGQLIRLEVTGDKGKLRFTASGKGAFLGYALTGEAWMEVSVSGIHGSEDGSEPSEEKFRPWRLTDRNEVWKWIDRILERKTGQSSSSDSIPTFADGYKVQAVMEAVMQSSVERKWVAVRS